MANELRGAAQSGKDIYAIVRRPSDGKVWSVAATDWATWSDGSIDDYDVALASGGGDLYLGDFPTDIVAGTTVLVQYFIRAGASPATSDLLLITTQRSWDGAGLTESGTVTLASDALTDLTSTKRYLGESGSDRDDLLKQLINAVSARVRTVTARRFTTTRRVMRLPILGRDVILDDYPIVELHAVRTGYQDAATARYTGTDVLASVGVYETSVVLRSVAADGTETKTTLQLATYPTVSTLVTAIDAVTDWSATLYHDADSRWLYEGTRYALAVDAPLTYPSVDVDADMSMTQLDAGMISLREPCRGVLVDATVGYDTVPADVQMVVHRLVGRAAELAERGEGLASESLGDYSYSLASGVEMESSESQILARYASERTIIG